MAPTSFQTIDDYIASFPAEVQDALRQLRRTIKEAAPGAGEKISYQMPTFTLGGSNLVHFAAYKHHIGLYGVSAALEAFKDDLSPYLAAKATLRFPLDRPLPLPLISDVVKFRVQEIVAKSPSKTARKAPSAQ